MVLAKDLRQAVLQAALQGKLTEQLETDSNVDEMLVNIQNDKEARITNGYIKGDKRLITTIIDEEEAPFAIPINWRWTTLGSIVYKLTDGTHKTPKYTTNGVKFISVKNISAGVLDLSETKYISQKEHDELYKRCNPEKGDMLLSKIGTTGVPAIVNTEEKFSLFVSVALLKYSHQFINETFLYYLLLSPLVQEQAKENTRGVGNKNWVLDFIVKTIIPLPPIEEQQRIVDKINKIISKIDEYEKIEKELEGLKKEFPTDMKDALLQAAMQGKLTEQLESDSSVDRILTSIKKKKEELIAQKKIKREKLLSDIEGEEIPFDIPENWRWVRLNEIGEIVGGGTPKTSQAEFWNNGNIPWITPADMNSCGRYIKHGEKCITQLGMDNSSAKLFPQGSVIMSSRAPIGYISIAQNEATTSQGCKTFSAYLQDLILSEFIYYAIQFRVPDMEKRATGTTFKEISGKGVGETMIPFPPIEEQHRIVERLDALLPLCEYLKEK